MDVRRRLKIERNGELGNREGGRFMEIEPVWGKDFPTQHPVK